MFCGLLYGHWDNYKFDPVPVVLPYEIWCYVISRHICDEIWSPYEYETSAQKLDGGSRFIPVDLLITCCVLIITLGLDD